MLTPDYINSFPELSIRVLTYLTLPDIFACQRVHSTLYALIKGSTLLQYHVATQLAGVEDNPWSTTNLHERFEKVSMREIGWIRQEFDFTRTVPVTHDHSGIYDLSGGVYFLGNRDRRAMHYCTLPSKETDKARWEKIDTDANIIDIGLAVYEHDLLAIATIAPQDDQYTIEIVLLEFSTGESHSQAGHPQLFVTKTQWAHPSAFITIIGDVLALIIAHYDNPSSPDDNLYVFNWKTGALKLHSTAPNDSYADLIFLSESIFLVPNANEGSLEFWDLTHSHPIGALGLPPLNPGYTFSDIASRCEPNPTPSGTPHSSLPFHTSSLDAIALFNICVERGEGFESTFSMFVHRSALLRLCPTPPSDGGTFNIIPWFLWGPRISRWMGGGSTRWITTTSGERAVLTAQGAGGSALVDFRLIRLRANGSQVNQGVHIEGPGVFFHSAFNGPIDSSLPFARQVLTGMDDYNGGLLMDEERLIGVKLDDLEMTISDIVVYHFGPKPAGETGYIEVL